MSPQPKRAPSLLCQPISPSISSLRRQEWRASGSIRVVLGWPPAGPHGSVDRRLPQTRPVERVAGKSCRRQPAPWVAFDKIRPVLVVNCSDVALFCCCCRCAELSVSPRAAIILKAFSRSRWTFFFFFSLSLSLHFLFTQLLTEFPTGTLATERGPSTRCWQGGGTNRCRIAFEL